MEIIYLAGTGITSLLSWHFGRDSGIESVQNAAVKRGFGEYFVDENNLREFKWKDSG